MRILRFRQKIGWEMGFGQNFGWEMGFVTPPLQDPLSRNRFLLFYLVQFVSANVNTRLFIEQKLCACLKVKLLLKVTVFRDLYLIPWR